jgi:sugar-specific transcriptional regulator TrmB
MKQEKSEDSSLLRVGEFSPLKFSVLNKEKMEQTLEKIKKDLITFGLTSREANIYIHLARLGPKKANKIAEELKTHRTETYHALTALQNKGIVTATLERPINFVALPFEKAIEKIIKLEKEKVNLSEKRSQYLFKLWHSLPDTIDKEVPIRQFQIFEGIDQAYGKLNEIILNINSEICIMASKFNLARLDQEGILDQISEKNEKRRISIKLLTGLDSKKLIEEIMEKKSFRFLSGDISPIPHFIIADKKELVFFTSKDDAPRKKTSAIWTNYDVFTKALYIMLIKMWDDNKPKE